MRLTSTLTRPLNQQHDARATSKSQQRKNEAPAEKARQAQIIPSKPNRTPKPMQQPPGRSTGQGTTRLINAARATLTSNRYHAHNTNPDDAWRACVLTNRALSFPTTQSNVWHLSRERSHRSRPNATRMLQGTWRGTRIIDQIASGTLPKRDPPSNTPECSRCHRLTADNFLHTSRLAIQDPSSPRKAPLQSERGAPRDFGAEHHANRMLAT